MKHQLYLAVLGGLVLALAVTATAQPGLELGLRGGLSIAGLGDENSGFVTELRSLEELVSDFSDNYEAKSLSGFQFGAFATINIGTSFAVQPEFLFSKRGAKIEGVATIPIGIAVAYYPIEEKLELSYIEIPVLLKYRIPMQGNLKPSLFAGPALTFNLSGTDDLYMRAHLDSAGVEIDHIVVQGKPDINNIKSTSLSIVLGGDIKLQAGSANFVLDVRYTIGTGNVFEDVNPALVDDVDLLDDLPSELPVVNWETGKAPDMKDRAFSITLGVSVPM